MTFGAAVAEAKTGAHVARASWNGRNMYVVHVPAGAWSLLFGNTTDFRHAAFLALKTTDNEYVPWTVSQTDAIAEDWYIRAKG